MNEIITAWINSQERVNLINELKEAANRRGSVDKSTFSRLTEFVAMELLIYGPVRVGAFTRMLLKTLRDVKPMWEHTERTTDPFTLPPEACIHQQNSAHKTDILGMQSQFYHNHRYAYINPASITDNNGTSGGELLAPRNYLNTMPIIMFYPATGNTTSQ